MFFQFISDLSSVKDLAKDQKTKDSDYNYTNWSIEQYYEYIMSNMSNYLFPY